MVQQVNLNWGVGKHIEPLECLAWGVLQDSPLHNHVERVLQIVDFSTFAKVDDVDLAE